MKKILFFTMSIFALTIFACGGEASHDHEHQHDQTEAHETAMHGEGKEYASAYVCPMHCEGSGSETAGTCPACDMDYVALTEHTKDGHHH